MISDQRAGRPRHQIGGLEHHGVAVAQRRRDLPCGDRDRKIPRRDQADDAERFARDLDVEAGTNRGDLLARHAQRLAGEERKDLARARDFADAFRQGLAFLARKQTTELVLARQNFDRDLVEHVVPRLRRRARPGRKRRLGGGDRGSGLRRVGPAYSPTTSVVSEGLMLRLTPAPSRQSPATKFFRVAFIRILPEARRRNASGMRQRILRAPVGRQDRKTGASLMPACGRLQSGPSAIRPQFDYLRRCAAVVRQVR